LAHERLGGVGELGKPVQAKKPARPFDRVNQPKDGVENGGVVRLALEPHKLDVDLIETLAGLGQEFRQ
jgi:hypothetical protein